MISCVCFYSASSAINLLSCGPFFLSYKYKPNQIRDIVITSKIEAIISALVLKWKTYKFKGTSTARDVTIHTIANTKYLFLLSRNVQTLINFGLTLLVFFIFCILDHITFTWKFIMLLYPISLLLMFNIGVGLILSALYVFFRDIQYLWSVFTLLLMYMSAIFYSIDSFSPQIQRLFLANPVFVFIKYFRNIVLDASIPSLQFHLLMLFETALLLGVGAWIYKKNNTKFLYYV